jgi:8-oxo-dGTP diphosphatase
MGIRSTAKAIIIDSGKVLLNKCYDENNGEYYVLPGGGQNTYETLQDAIVRECLEETGYTVYPVRFAALCEVICDNVSFRDQHADYAHKMYHIFICGLKNSTRLQPTEIDNMQLGSAWIDIPALDKIRLLPTALGENIQKVLDGVSPVFLGSEHIRYNHG